MNQRKGTLWTWRLCYQTNVLLDNAKTKPSPKKSDPELIENCSVNFSAGGLIRLRMKKKYLNYYNMSGWEN